MIIDLRTLIDKPLRVSKPEAEARAVACARTLTTLRMLDKERRMAVLRFLIDSRLIDHGVPIITFSSAALAGYDLSRVNLSRANLNVVSLIVATLRDADLSGADLSFATLRDADLSEANLLNAELSGRTPREGESFTGGYFKQFLFDQLKRIDAA